MKDRRKSGICFLLVLLLIFSETVSASAITVSNDAVVILDEILPTIQVSENEADSISDNETEDKSSLSENESISENESVSENESISENESVSENEVIADDEGVSDNDTVSENEVTSPLNGSQILHVECPTKINFAMDPLNICKMGQIFSQDYSIINYGSQPVEVEITDFYYEFSDPENGRSLREPFDKETESGMKDLYLYFGRAQIKKNESPSENEISRYYDEYTLSSQELPWGEQQLDGEPLAGEEDILITSEHLAEPVRIILGAANCGADGNYISDSDDSAVQYRFFGSMNPEPEVSWNNKNVSVYIEYRYKSIEKPEEEQ